MMTRKQLNRRIDSARRQCTATSNHIDEIRVSMIANDRFRLEFAKRAMLAAAMDAVKVAEKILINLE